MVFLRTGSSDPVKSSPIDTFAQALSRGLIPARDKTVYRDTEGVLSIQRESAWAVALPTRCEAAWESCLMLLERAGNITIVTFRINPAIAKLP
jgi:hypothetical protein